MVDRPDVPGNILTTTARLTAASPCFVGFAGLRLCVGQPPRKNVGAGVTLAVLPVLDPFSRIRGHSDATCHWKTSLLSQNILAAEKMEATAGESRVLSLDESVGNDRCIDNVYAPTRELSKRRELPARGTAVIKA